jgi:hypothetical protein
VAVPRLRKHVRLIPQSPILFGQTITDALTGKRANHDEHPVGEDHIWKVGTLANRNVNSSNTNQRPFVLPHRSWIGLACKELFARFRPVWQHLCA